MRILMVGFGVVGQSFAKLIRERSRDLLSGFGIRPRIVALVDKGGAAVNPKGLDLEKILLIKREGNSVAFDGENGIKGMNPLEVIEKVDGEILVELTPTNLHDGEPGLTHITTALKGGKHVITANKGPLALALPALMQLAQYNHVSLRFSGCVGGGTPILEFAKRCLEGDRIISLRGILNGTTNYILSKMVSENMSFEEALTEAQRAGYAEADPSMDIDGLDSAAKLTILANWILGAKVTIKDVRIKGIRGIALKDIIEANSKESEIKLIGAADGGFLQVSPQPVPKSHPLCVDGILNAVTFTSQYAGEETIIGRGAGGVETGSAILRDLIAVKRYISESRPA